MNPDNLIAASIPAEVKTSYAAKMAEAAALIAPYVRNVPTADRGSYTNIATKRAGMDDVFIRSMTDNPSLVASYIVMAHVNQDRDFRRDVADMVGAPAAQIEGLNDASLMAGSDSFRSYTAYYHAVQMAALRNVPGADTELAKLAPFFKDSGRRTGAAAAKRAKDAAAAAAAAGSQ